MDTILEQTRAAHEDNERLERLIVQELRKETKSHSDKLLQSHTINKYIQMIQDNARKLIKIYQDEDKSRIEEIQNLTGGISSFYQRNEEIRKYHRQFQSYEITEGDDQMNQLLESQAQNPIPDFTGEEGYGRYLDLNGPYYDFINSKFGKQIDYLEYLQTFYFFHDIPRYQKMQKAYRRYLESLLGYLVNFYKRTQPLGDIDQALNQLQQEFDKEFQEGKVVGWEDGGVSTQQNHQNGITQEVLNLDEFTGPEELTEVDQEKIKEALQALGLKVGGTPSQRAQRLWSTKGKSLDELDPKLFQKGMHPQQKVAENGNTENGPKNNGVVQNQLRDLSFGIALIENKIQKMCEVLGEVVDETRGQVEKKQAQTAEEREQEQEEGNDVVMNDEDSEEEETVYNPLKLPLGWDGKPIPYWLYKLHGLNQEFKCEICGNYSYWGRRAFEKHFKEWRHQNAMSALGIPNTKTFYEITKIEDALNLLKNLQIRGSGTKAGDDIEEYEDSEGNVYNSKTYADLKRQGLIN